MCVRKCFTLLLNKRWESNISVVFVEGKIIILAFIIKSSISYDIWSNSFNVRCQRYVSVNKNFCTGNTIKHILMTCRTHIVWWSKFILCCEWNIKCVSSYKYFPTPFLKSIQVASVCKYHHIPKYVNG